MPVMDGIESTRLVREHLAEDLKLTPEEQPVIVGVTGHVMAEFQKKGLEAGMNRVVGKPISLPSALANVLQHLDWHPLKPTLTINAFPIIIIY